MTKLRDKAREQLGTVGSGNHYVDVFCDELGRIWVGVHFGSRGFGHTVASGFLFYAYGMVLTQAFNGAGDTATPTWINLVCYWLIQLPLAYVLALPAGMGARGVFTAITVAQAVLAVVATFLFRRGGWKLKTI